jgi:ribosomal-protein-alanine N-acetyltransferase
MSLPSIRTDRLLLRPFGRDDVDDLHQLWTAPEVRQYLWDDAVIARETAQRIVESHLATVDRLNLGYWALHIPPSVPPIRAPIAGFCGFRLLDDGAGMDESPEIELLYGLRGQHWGKGLVTEACSAALEYLWRSTGYQRVYARTDPPNVKSVQVMRRLGMEHESTTPSMITYCQPRPAGAI